MVYLGVNIYIKFEQKENTIGLGTKVFEIKKKQAQMIINNSFLGKSIKK